MADLEYSVSNRGIELTIPFSGTDTEKTVELSPSLDGVQEAYILYQGKAVIPNWTNAVTLDIKFREKSQSSIIWGNEDTTLARNGTRTLSFPALGIPISSPVELILTLSGAPGGDGGTLVLILKSSVGGVSGGSSGGSSGEQWDEVTIDTIYTSDTSASTPYTGPAYDTSGYTSGEFLFKPTAIAAPDTEDSIEVGIKGELAGETIILGKFIDKTSDADLITLTGDPNRGRFDKDYTLNTPTLLRLDMLPDSIWVYTVPYDENDDDDTSIAGVVKANLKGGKT